MVTIQIDDDQLVRSLQELAARENRSVEAILKSLLDQYAQQNQALDAMDGVFDDDIPDLSTSVRETIENYYQQRDESSN